jgi:hypothetical protein
MMRLHRASTLERSGALADDGRGESATWPVTLDQWDFSTPHRDEVMALLTPSRDPRRTIWLVAAALAGGFGLGWAGAWYGPATITALNQITQTETASRRSAETKPGGKSEAPRKTASTSILRTSSTANQVSAVASIISAKPLAKWSDGAHSVAPSSATSPVIQADVTVTGSIEPRAPLTPAPDTRPTTIEGWTVLDVRGGTAVLAGPDGVRMAMRGDTVPGIGRIDSIVRWGNQWIVATDSGLIATP